MTKTKYRHDDKLTKCASVDHTKFKMYLVIILFSVLLNKFIFFLNLLVMNFFFSFTEKNLTFKA